MLVLLLLQVLVLLVLLVCVVVGVAVLRRGRSGCDGAVLLESSPRHNTNTRHRRCRSRSRSSCGGGGTRPSGKLRPWLRSKTQELVGLAEHGGVLPYCRSRARLVVVLVLVMLVLLLLVVGLLVLVVLLVRLWLVLMLRLLWLMLWLGLGLGPELMLVLVLVLRLVLVPVLWRWPVLVWLHVVPSARRCVCLLCALRALGLWFQPGCSGVQLGRIIGVVAPFGRVQVPVAFERGGGWVVSVGGGVMPPLG